jgi:hypothetical protein
VRSQRLRLFCDVSRNVDQVMTSGKFELACVLTYYNLIDTIASFRTAVPAARILSED